MTSQIHSGRIERQKFQDRKISKNSDIKKINWIFTIQKNRLEILFFIPWKGSLLANNLRKFQSKHANAKHIYLLSFPCWLTSFLIWLTGDHKSHLLVCGISACQKTTNQIASSTFQTRERDMDKLSEHLKPAVSERFFKIFSFLETRFCL